MAFSKKYIVPLFQDYFSGILVVTLVGFVGCLYLRKKKGIRDGPTARPRAKDPSRRDSDDEEWTSNLVHPLIPDNLPHIPFVHQRLMPEEALERAEKFYCDMNCRRSIRFFSCDPVPEKIIENLIKTAGTAPSGAHTEPWFFVAVKDPEIKARVREIVEAEEEINYSKRMGVQWTHDLRGLKTDWVKEYLT